MQNIIKYIVNLFTTAANIHKRHKFVVGQIVNLDLYGHQTQIQITKSNLKSRCYKVKWLDENRTSSQTKDFINKYAV